MSLNQEYRPVQKGEVYLLGNLAMPGMYKIGHTQRSLETRIAELSRSTSVPRPFYLIVALRSYQPRLVEMQVHARLQAYRANQAREFFEFPDDREAAIAFLTQVVDSGVYEPVTRRPQVAPAPEPVPVLSEEEQRDRDAARFQRNSDAIQSLRALLDNGGAQ
ncbi:hypothetical protein FIU88_08135 [Halomonas sp. THAF12]|uniref:GIY-YIG nuclease family protein n=1 Tax=Halomonas sp. THAF12 TaxID=2587849 RepID=UPI001268E70B|nr:GIY-YIG nuclease family protein [Halomonas sp. THAF12]QFT84942.1 hypothetical protein FIU88_08135 [Halomonas sp. THAF12]